MPKISEFFGISIYLYFREHPPPHFHARYGGSEALVSIEELAVLEGVLLQLALDFRLLRSYEPLNRRRNHEQQAQA